MGHGKKELMKDGHVIAVLHFDLIDGYVDVVAQAGTASDVVVVGFSQIRPESALHVGMNRKVQHSKKNQIVNITTMNLMKLKNKSKIGMNQRLGQIYAATESTRANIYSSITEFVGILFHT